MKSNGIYEVDQSNRIEDMKHDSYIVIAKKLQRPKQELVRYAIKIPKAIKPIWFAEYRQEHGDWPDEKYRLFAPTIFAKATVALMKAKRFLPVAAYALGSKNPRYKKETVTPIRKEVAALFRQEFTRVRNAHDLLSKPYQTKKTVSRGRKIT